MLTQNLPVNPRCEQAVLGAIFANNKAFDLCGSLRPEHFSDPIHAELFAAIERRIKAGQIVDAVSLKAFVENTGICDEVGGVAYLPQLITAMVGLQLVPEYARAIQDCALRRQLIALAEDMRNRAFGTELDHGDGIQTAAHIIARIEAALADSGAPGTVRLDAAADAMLAPSKGGPKLPALYMGLRTLDDAWGGLFPGALEIIGARPRTGKTTFALQLARSVARQGHHVGLISGELPARDVALFNLMSLTGIAADRIRKGELDLVEAEELILARKSLTGLPIDIHDAPGSLSEVIGQLRLWKRRNNCRLAIIDHRDLIGRDAGTERQPLQEWYPHVTRTLKKVAKALDLSVLLLIQLSRDIERRDDPRPRLSDLMYAGEQDADNVLLLHRAVLYLGEFPTQTKNHETGEDLANRQARWYAERSRLEKVSEVILAKRRFGQPAGVQLAWDGRRVTFRDMEVEEVV